MSNERLENHPARRFAEIMGILARHHVARGMTPVKLREILEDLGPAFVKFGQIMSMRPDMIPLEYCKELEKLRTDVIPLSFDVILPAIESELKQPADRVFSYINPVPLGSASVAQVHSAILTDGRHVVLKVQRPGILQTMYEDIRLISNNIFLIRKIMGLSEMLDLKEILNELWKTSQQELDFLNEAAAIDRYRKNIDGLVYVTCPKVYRKYTTEHLLTMSHIHGYQIDQVRQLEEAGYDLHEIARKTAENYCKQVLDDGFFHADPHPGNLIVTGGQIAWIDWGMTGEISSHLRSILISAIRAIWENVIYALENAFLMIGEPKKPINQARLITQMNAIVQEYRSADFGHFNVGILLHKFLDLITENEIVIPPDLTIVSRSVITMEGTVSKIDPDVSLMEIFSTHLRTEAWNNFDLRKSLEKHSYGLYKSIMKSMDIPADTSDVLGLAKSGKLTLNIIENTSPDTLRANRGNMRRLIYAVMLFTFFLCGAILALSGISPRILGLPWPSVIGFLLGIVMLCILIVSILRWRK